MPGDTSLPFLRAFLMAPVCSPSRPSPSADFDEVPAYHKSFGGAHFRVCFLLLPPNIFLYRVHTAHKRQRAVPRAVCGRGSQSRSHQRRRYRRIDTYDGILPRQERTPHQRARRHRSAEARAYSVSSVALPHPPTASMRTTPFAAQKCARTRRPPSRWWCSPSVTAWRSAGCLGISGREMGGGGMRRRVGRGDLVGAV